MSELGVLAWVHLPLRLINLTFAPHDCRSQIHLANDCQPRVEIILEQAKKYRRKPGGIFSLA